MSKRSEKENTIDNTTRGDTIRFPFLRRAMEFVVGIVTTAVVAVVRVVQRIFMTAPEYKKMLQEADRQKEADERTDAAVKNAGAMTKELQAMLVKERQISPETEEPVKSYKVRACEPVINNKTYKIDVVLRDGTKLSLFATSELKLYPESLCPSDVLKATQKRLDKMRARFVEKKETEKPKEPAKAKEKVRNDGQEAEKPKLKIAEFERAINAARDTDEKTAETPLVIASYAVKMVKGRFVVDAVLTNGKTLKYTIENGKPVTPNIEPAKVKALIEKHVAEILAELKKTRTLPDYMTEKTEEKEKKAIDRSETGDQEPERERQNGTEEREEKQVGEEEKKEEKPDRFAELSAAALFSLYVREVMNGPSNLQNPELTVDEAMTLDNRIADITHDGGNAKNVVLDIEDRKIAIVWGDTVPGGNMRAAAKLMVDTPDLSEKLPTDEVAGTIASAIEDGAFASGMCAVCGGISFSLHKTTGDAPELQLTMLDSEHGSKIISFAPEVTDIGGVIESGLQGLICPEIDDPFFSGTGVLSRDVDLELAEGVIGGR